MYVMYSSLETVKSDIEQYLVDNFERIARHSITTFYAKGKSVRFDSNSISRIIRESRCQS